MKLLMSPTSPYARVVRAVIIEKRLDDEVEMVPTDPWESGKSLLSANPFSRIPVLVTDSGIELTESLLIVDYLEWAHPSPELIPRDRLEAVLHKTALGIGLVDSTIGIVTARKFDASADANGLVQRRHAALERAVPAIARTSKSTADAPDLGDLAIAVGLAYLEFRLPDLAWRETEADLGEWVARMTERPSLARTAPPS